MSNDLKSLRRVAAFLKGLVNAMSDPEDTPYPEAVGSTLPSVYDINLAIDYLEEDTENYEEKFNLDELGME